MLSPNSHCALGEGPGPPCVPLQAGSWPSAGDGHLVWGLFLLPKSEGSVAPGTGMQKKGALSLLSGGRGRPGSDWGGEVKGQQSRQWGPNGGGGVAGGMQPGHPQGTRLPQAGTRTSWPGFLEETSHAKMPRAGGRCRPGPELAEAMSLKGLSPTP
jgi:hypothetical protein